jgi:hypothetical protein
MLALFFATLCAGIFCGGALYINFVEHPARISCAWNQPATVRAELQTRHGHAASLAIAALLFGLAGSWQLRDALAAVGAAVLGSVVPFTLIVILPTNKQLLDPTLDARSERAAALLARWNRLHAVRSALSAAGLRLMLWRLASACVR